MPLSWVNYFPHKNKTEKHQTSFPHHTFFPCHLSLHRLSKSLLFTVWVWTNSIGGVLETQTHRSLTPDLLNENLNKSQVMCAHPLLHTCLKAPGFLTLPTVTVGMYVVRTLTQSTKEMEASAKKRNQLLLQR